MKILQRITAYSGILFLIVIILAIGATAGSGVTEQAMEAGDVAGVLTIMAGRLGLVVAAMWLFNLANVFMAVYGVGLAALWGEDHPWLRFAATLIILSVAGFLIETTMTIGFAKGLAPAYAAATGPDQVAAGTSGLALIYFRNATALWSGMMVAVAGLLFGWAGLKTPGWPRWVAWLALASGILGLLGGLYPFLPFLSYVRAISQLLFAIWALVVGIKLLRS